MLAEIITIGDEILIGQIVDTNSAWIARQLNDIGISVKQISSVSDDRKHIIEALAAASKRAGLILITGGLGPTNDDITKKTLAEYFGVGMRRDEDTLKNVERIFARLKIPMPEVNVQQADVPENCTVLQNKNGTAPGMWFERGDNIYISLPGVPFEMMILFEEEVIPRLKTRPGLQTIVHYNILTAGIGESFLAQKIASVENSLPKHIKLAYLPKLGQVRLRFSAYGHDETLLRSEIDHYVQQLDALIGKYIITYEDKPIEKVILDFMDAGGLTLCLAESCTGGYLSHLITLHPGCSKVFLGGVVSYSYHLKELMLDVSEETLNSMGAVSEETVKEMVTGTLKRYGSDYAIAVSGIAGPDGGTSDKPVGTVWIAVAGKNKTIARKFQFGNKRLQNIERSAVSAFIMLFNLLKEEHP
jgi:nicotinamide-nucleotide amidase